MLRLWDDLNDRYAPPEVVRELARIALASLGAEPVAYIFKHPAGKLFWALTDESNKDQSDVIPVYASSPAPIASEAIENAIEYIRSIAFHIDEDDYHGKHIAYFMRQALAWLEGNSCSDDRQGKVDNQPASGNQAAESNRGNEWTGNPDIDNAIIMLDRIDTAESCDDDRIEAVKAVLRRLAGNSPVIPGEVLSAIMKVARVRADFDDFDGDRRGIGDCLDEAEQELIVTINKYASQLAAEPIATNDVREQQTAVPPVPEIQADVAQAIENLKQKLVECNRYNYCADAVKGVEDACHAAMLQGIQPVSQTYNLPELIEGMEVSIDVSTCDADLGNRYFGTVTEALELDTAKNGYILLVQDAEPNFDINGNSPGTPDSWISCSERMPIIGEINWRTSFPLLITCEIGVIPAYYGFVSFNGDRHYGFMESLKYGDDSGGHPQTNEYGLISNVTHWMPLPEPPEQDGE